ncbi:shikimate 5-dehydrogenase [Paractinoplanes abujensis]|uniref:Shikimate dehydrogenase n=1 Tax=Paractinoplanes abujensis TaxID=882441 RepID=A0A7W7G7A8_9ACTN|nr:shikimate dehydrogenase [Actinoplanes abujensis]MBB4698305.1 shikimate dehydrogenase [Actinoplanes abujensis]GID19210.1 shikimate 5-dehydrogenase [Actinoplanes abujensis]
MTAIRRAAVCGMPISHSLSPVIHNAGFAAAGLSGWSYGSFECGQADLAALVGGLGPEWAGLSLTMPLKEEGLRLAAAASPVAVAIGAANTLVRREDGSWQADNTDVAGMVRVLREAGLKPAPTVSVLGGGGTARAALAAAADLGASAVTVVTRRPAAREELIPVATALGLAVLSTPWELASTAFEADAVISTVPKGAADHLAGDVPWRAGTVLFDAIYDPWPTPLAADAQAHGVPVLSGLDLLLAQALSQFEQFTGVKPAPEEAMRAALLAAAAAR